MGKPFAEGRRSTEVNQCQEEPFTGEVAEHRIGVKR